ncbi:hypothetical protein WA026_005992 [Henosepilachna vigintioctopunctata]|uniref:Uncharacterized protein n=1 Tax=Henosepilachna vigintioctopunctata TaxID=420089 RepID=A0AAW1U3J1_9CUCU
MSSEIAEKLNLDSKQRSQTRRDRATDDFNSLLRTCHVLLRHSVCLSIRSTRRCENRTKWTINCQHLLMSLLCAQGKVVKEKPGNPVDFSCAFGSCYQNCDVAYKSEMTC